MTTGNYESAQISEQVLRQRLDDLDLEPIKVKLMSEVDGEGWSLEKVNTLEVAYKRFLFLCWKYRGQHSIVPSADVDEFWHQHILDTRKYQRDCEMVLGFFVHHFPYFGMRGEEDARNLRNSFATTLELYRANFPEDPDAVWKVSTDTCNSCGVSDCTACGSGGGGEIMEDVRPRLSDALAM